MRGFVFPWLLIWCKGLDREIMAADPMVHLTADPTANTIQVATSNVATNAKLPPAQQPAPPEVLRRSNGNGKEARKLTAPILLLDQNSSAIPPSIAKYLRLSPDLNGRMCNFNVKKWKDIDGSIFTKEYHTWSLTHSTELANCVKADYVGHAEDKSVTHSHDLKKLKYHNLLRCLIQQVAQVGQIIRGTPPSPHHQALNATPLFVSSPVSPIDRRSWIRYATACGDAARLQKEDSYCTEFART